ncbi:acetyltransferase [Micromonospora sp. ATCC 39149]|uniref:GNAT family N-acetyltransferase n=1 Tax=Micromonospora carbonacea TaxID=47853 RepID=A0A7D5YEY3_9ACTN|nr:GNAT family N-acetyltransferase [Micromonospora sp. ATCC 39149]EEP73974.1 acetyltransferase [Micromonospora sp. ATCC 39149]QLJ99853.1 GNAT family N-acetyltransferase [Micromonospora carbonacea]
MTVLTTERLVVRDWTADPGDLARIYDIYSRPEVIRWLGAASGLPLTDPAGAADRLAWWRERHAGHGSRYGTWAIEARATGLVVGTVLLKPLPGRDERVPTTDIEVGWHLHPDSWGHGYATEAARAVVTRELAAGTPQVWAVVAPGNAASAAVARRLGMAHVGRRTDWYGGEELDAFVLRADG